MEFETLVVHFQVTEYDFTGSQWNGLKVTTAEEIVKDNRTRRQSATQTAAYKKSS